MYNINGLSKADKIFMQSRNQSSKFKTKNWVEINMTRVECIAPIVKLN